MERLIEDSHALCENSATPTHSNYSLKMSKHKQTNKHVFINKTLNRM